MIPLATQNIPRSPSATPVQAAAARLGEGTDVGGLRVVEHTRDKLLLRSPQWFEKLMLLVAVACLVVGAARLASPGTFGTPRTAGSITKDWGFVVLCVGLGAAFVSVHNFRRSWVLDGRARTATRVRGFTTRTWSGSDVRAVSVRVTHVGPNEVLAVVLETAAGEEEVAVAPSDRRGLNLPAAAARVAELLVLPLTRSGAAVQGGPEVRGALDRIGPAPEGVEALGDGRDLVINCPACRRQHVPAVSYEHHEHTHGLSHTTTWVKCLACGTSLYSKAPAEQLVGRSPEELAPLVVFRLSLIARATAILAAALCLLPWVGLGMALLATLITWRTRGWPRPVSRVALAVSVLPTVGIMILLKTKP